MYFKQFIVDGLGCLSYLIGCPASKKACVVDPKRDVLDYIETAKNHNMKITHIFETHVHADHVSGNMELQSRTGADIYFFQNTPVSFPHKTVREGDTFSIGKVKLDIIKTPGHTPHALSILVTDKTRSDQPWLVLTGDCMFVGDIGRPDLAGKELLDEQVKNLYESLYNKLGKLPPSLEVFPAHGEGSLCGKGMSSKSSSTIGFEQANNPVLNLSWPDFKIQLSQSFPERPKSFSHIIKTNMNGAPLLERCPVIRDLSPDQVKSYIEKDTVILDTRDTASFGGVHIPGSINIGFAKQTANWIGMVISPETNLILVVKDETEYHAMCTQLHRIGYDNILGYLFGGITNWQEAGYPINQLWQISTTKLHDKIANKHYNHLLDVRTDQERSSGYIKESRHIPLSKLLKDSIDLPKDEEIVTICGVGYRGNIAASFLQSQGFKHVHSLAGGMKAWINTGYPLTQDGVIV